MNPPVGYVRLHTGADGASHFSDETFSLQEIDGTGGVLRSTPIVASRYEVRVVPPGWRRDWGPAAHPVLAIYLSGEGEIQASDGEVRRIVPGLILLAEDTSGPGHRVRVTNDEPVTVIQIHLPARTAPESAG